MNPSNDDTKIMYYVFDENTRTVSKHNEDFSVLYNHLNDIINHRFLDDIVNNDYFRSRNIKDLSYYRREILSQIVECITHNMPYNIILNSASAACAREIFLLMEQYPDYSFCFDVAGSLSLETDIRELRRTITICKVVNPKWAGELFDIVKNRGWLVLASVCDLIEAFGSVEAGLDKYHEIQNHVASTCDLIGAFVSIGLDFEMVTTAIPLALDGGLR